MPRRRYRLFTVCAVVVVFMLYRVVQNSWDDTSLRLPLHKAPTPGSGSKLEDVARPGGVDLSSPGKGQSGAAEDVVTGNNKGMSHSGQGSDAVGELAHGGGKKSSSESLGVEEMDAGVGEYTPGVDAGKAANAANAAAKEAATKGKTSLEDSIHAQNPPKGGHDETTDDYADEDEDEPAPVEPTKIHWQPVPEKFPVDRLQRLPKGLPKKIPKIQYDFGPETESAKATRLQRQKRVKLEMERAWAGYKTYAWMHDELSPVSGKYRDPFCGWAATLVDSLDTLWIAGMKEEFEYAVKAVKDIDFTWTPRRDIPVFETTIRYLGGLVAAYDVSGDAAGGYKILLDKAVELAEILLGIFDTPNRMPLLYYLWKPEFASQPHRAGRVGIAELATLSMEFTRLAQITGEDKYYDGIDRITDALVEMQKAGTAIPGLFPTDIDASGCNKTATTIRDSLSAQAQKQMDADELLQEPKGYVPGKQSDASEHGIGGSKIPPTSPDDRVARRDETTSLESEKEARAQNAGESSAQQKTRKPPFAADGTTSEWDCVPQGLVPLTKYQYFHMGGAQDSAYEYFPKEYLLLGGLESKYKKLHEDAVDAVNEWLLYRPMTKDDEWDILFPAKVSTAGVPEKDIVPTFEITHLTCFIGGMYGLGGKAFGRDQDIDTAKKLTDGCVWAYQLMPSGLMPETAHVVPCPTLEKCDFNETLWWEKLDPNRERREKDRVSWEEQEAQKALAPDNGSPWGKPGSIYRDDGSSYASDPAEKEPLSSAYGTARNKATVEHKKKRFDGDSIGATEPPLSLGQKLNSTWQESTQEHSFSDESAHGVELNARTPPTAKGYKTKPPTHEEYVAQRLAKEKLPPGFTNIGARSYVLRPEAIESVWYMYRITGDPSWMDKGWAMFEATVRASRTEFANSAIDDVTVDEPELKDQMESFWLAETLKYYYMLFSEPGLVSLDEWVLNTEAHPFRRPT